MRVSKSGYYEYVHKRNSNAQIERKALEGFVKDIFERHHARYGYRHINQELRKIGIFVSEKRVILDEFGYVPFDIEEALAIPGHHRLL